MTRFIRRHSLIVLAVSSTALMIGIGWMLYRRLDPPLGLILLVALPASELAAFFILWAALRRRAAPMSVLDLEQALGRGRPVVIEVFSNT